MQMQLQREPPTAKSTTGKLFIDDAFFCYTLEDIVRPDPDPSTPINEAKIPGRTAIPAATYVVIVDRSPLFSLRAKRSIYTPHLLDVPGFTGIRIHPGNTDVDTEGCILVGKQKGPDRIWDSRLTYTALMNRIAEIVGTDTEGYPKWQIKEPTQITIVDALPAEQAAGNVG